MTDFISEERKKLGLSQQKLAELSGLCLATIQNIESQKANPSLKVLNQILEILGLEMKISKKEFDWDDFSYFSGLLTPKKKKKNFVFEKNQFKICIERAALEISNSDKYFREKECLESLLLALKMHYPTFYRKKFKNSPLVNSFLLPISKITGKHIKLRRIALGHLGGKL